MNNMALLIENTGYASIVLNESNNNKVLFSGKFQEADAVNKNKRIYPFAVLDSNVKRLQESIKNRCCYGELDHPDSSIISLSKSAFITTGLRWDGTSLIGEGEVLPTPAGMVLRKLLESGCRVGISSRGVGTGKMTNEGILEISSDYRMVSFDCVHDPSTHEAFQKVIVKDKKESYQPVHQTSYTEEVKYMDPNSLVSYFGCLLEQKKKIKKS